MLFKLSKQKLITSKQTYRKVMLKIYIKFSFPSEIVTYSSTQTIVLIFLYTILNSPFPPTFVTHKIEVLRNNHSKNFRSSSKLFLMCPRHTIGFSALRSSHSLSFRAMGYLLQIEGEGLSSDSVKFEENTIIK